MGEQATLQPTLPPAAVLGARTSGLQPSKQANPVSAPEMPPIRSLEDANEPAQLPRSPAPGCSGTTLLDTPTSTSYSSCLFTCHWGPQCQHRLDHHHIQHTHKHALQKSILGHKALFSEDALAERMQTCVSVLLLLG